MNGLGIRLRDRVISRIVFYVILVTGMWATNRLLPEGAGNNEFGSDDLPGVVAPLIAVPATQIPSGLGVPVSR